jgi:hypothetical protein
LLAEREAICISYATRCRILKAAGISSKRAHRGGGKRFSRRGTRVRPRLRMKGKGQTPTCERKPPTLREPSAGHGGQTPLTNESNGSDHGLRT